MYRVDSIIIKRQSDYVLDSDAAIKIAQKLAKQAGVTIEMINIYDDKGEIVYRYIYDESTTVRG